MVRYRKNIVGKGVWPGGGGVAKGVWQGGDIKNTKNIIFFKIFEKSSQNKKHKFRRKLNIFLEKGCGHGMGCGRGKGGGSKKFKKMSYYQKSRGGERKSRQVRR